MNKVILDASALLAVLHEEAGYQHVEPYLSSAYMSAVNVSEVLSVLNAVGVSMTQANSFVTSIIQHIIPFETEQAYISAELKAHTKAQGLSLGDRACLALAQQLKLPVLTADKAWGKIKTDVKIHVIR